MRRYKKFKKKSVFNGYMIFALFIVGIISLSIGYSYFSESLTISGISNAKYFDYEITYMLNGGENPGNVVTSYKIIDNIPLPIPTRGNYVFDGWYDNSDFIGTRLMNTSNLGHSDITLYAKWKREVNYSAAYSYEGEYVFTGDNYINTNVYLYNEENMSKNFLISFDIEEVSDVNVNHSTLLSSMDESGSPFSGHNVKVSVSGNTKRRKFESNSNTSSTGDVYIPDTVTNIRIIRINNILYYSFDGADCVRINNYNGFTGYLEDVPVTFGAALNEFGNPFRFFTGTLSNMLVCFVGDDAVIDDFNPEKEEMEVRYAHNGEYVFNGTSDYIDTGLSLFTRETFGKDFEISFNIVSVDPDFVNQATIVNAKNEKITSYPGFVYRLYQDQKTVKFEAKAGSGSGSNHKISAVQKVKISRIDSKMYLSINDATPVQVYDYTNFTNFFDVPITIGASLNNQGLPFRFFKGTLSDIVVKVEK